MTSEEYGRISLSDNPLGQNKCVKSRLPEHGNGVLATIALLRAIHKRQRRFGLPGRLCGIPPALRPRRLTKRKKILLPQFRAATSLQFLGVAPKAVGFRHIAYDTRIGARREHR